MTLLINILVGLFVVVSLLMILVILMQRPKSEGLGAAFGGGVTENLFGAQTTNVLTKVTGWLAAIFFLLTFILSILYARKANIDRATSAAKLLTVRLRLRSHAAISDDVLSRRFSFTESRSAVGPPTASPAI